jgi:hypothetical protein
MKLVSHGKILQPFRKLARARKGARLVLLVKKVLASSPCSGSLVKFIYNPNCENEGIQRFIGGSKRPIGVAGSFSITV